MRLRVISQDNNYVAVHKPTGLVTYSDDGSVKGAKEILEKQIKKRLFPVHRIDKDTCGVLVFALNEGVARELTALFRSRVVKKKYLAVVHGAAPLKGVIDEPLERNKDKVNKVAVTEFTRLATVDVDGANRARSSAGRCEMKTGRYHQIRRHMRLAGHPCAATRNTATAGTRNSSRSASA